MQLTARYVREVLAPFAVDVDERLASQLSRYMDTLLFWNQKINLTSITSPEKILQRHFGESMFGARMIGQRAGLLIDIGSGAGFPGLPLKLVCPHLDVRLVEPVMKKAVFLSEVIRVLELSRIDVMRERIEDLHDSATADIVTVRAVGETLALLGGARRILAAAGVVMMWLGAQDAKTTVALAGWDWMEPVPIPLSTNRVILLGSPTG